MAEYVYKVHVKAYVQRVARGMGGAGLQLNQAEHGGFGPTDTPGNAPSGQVMYFQANEMVPNAIATPPSAANIGTALTSAATDIQTKITAPILAQIQNWSLGGE
jgi:hypothetical protein